MGAIKNVESAGNITKVAKNITRTPEVKAFLARTSKSQPKVVDLRIGKYAPYGNTSTIGAGQPGVEALSGHVTYNRPVNTFNTIDEATGLAIPNIKLFE